MAKKRKGKLKIKLSKPDNSNVVLITDTSLPAYHHFVDSPDHRFRLFFEDPKSNDEVIDELRPNKKFLRKKSNHSQFLLMQDGISLVGEDIASDENKPNGICVVTPDKLDNFVIKLPLGKIPGVGKVTLAKLNNMGLYNCADVRQFPFEDLVKRFGKFGSVIWDRSHGLDNRNLSLTRQRKSVGVERTLAEDIHSQDECLKMIDSLFPLLEQRLNKTQAHIQSQGIKLKFSDFQQTTVEHKCQVLDKNYFLKLLTEGLSRQANRGIRLVGLHVALAEITDNKQLAFSFSSTQD
tara:strand:+ start:237 stop:1115 length:879 start_codon:yes stop_codon:yes gene_type:complete